jgi:hypothetical protein
MGVKLTTHLQLVPRLKNAWKYASTPHYAFMAWCSVKKEHRDNFTLDIQPTIKSLERDTVKEFTCTRVYPKVSGLIAWSENCKWYSCLPLGAVLSLFFESVW